MMGRLTGEGHYGDGTGLAAQPSAVFGIAMHMVGEPHNMQDIPYDFAPIDIYEVLKSHIDQLAAAGLARSHIAIWSGRQNASP